MRADVTVNLNVRPEIKTEWENLRKHDVCFLITVKPQNPIGKLALQKSNYITTSKLTNVQVLATITRSLSSPKWA